MSISTELDRLIAAKTAIRNAIEAQGVTVPAIDTLEDYAAHIAAISSGGSLTPPSITTQPVDQSALIGATATFTASAPNGSPVAARQWQEYSGTGGAPVLVQSSPVVVEGYPSAVATLGATPQVGNVLIITGSWNPSYGANPTGIAITDNQTGNTYASLVNASASFANGCFIGYCLIQAAVGSFQVTATQTGGAADAGMVISVQEWSGLTGALDQTNQAEIIDNNPGLITALAPNASANNLVVAVIGSRANGLTVTNSPPITGFANAFARASGGQEGFSAYKLTSAIETSSANWGAIVIGSGGNVPIIIATFPASGGGSWSNLSGATSQNYTTPTLVSGDNGKQFRFTDTNSSGAVTSNAASLIVS